MLSNWKRAPATVKTLVVYWHIWPVTFIALFGYFSSASPDGEVLSFMWSLLKAEYQVTPIALWIGAGIILIYFLCPLYAWRMLAGRKTSRKLLEVFAWLFLVNSLIDVTFQITDTQDQWAFVEILFVIIDAFVLLAMRSKQVREYANVF
jgi:hypothetical protein